MADIKKGANEPFLYDNATDNITGLKNSDSSEKKFVYTDGSSGAVRVTDTTESTSTTTGALVVTGGLGVGGAIYPGGNVVMASGKGIDFSADANAAGMTSELLDDYEEGTWTPTFTSGVTTPTYTFNSGVYTKIGRLVFVQVRLDLLGGTANGSAVEIGTLPFAPIASNFINSGGFITASSGWVASNDVALPTVYVGIESTLRLFQNDGTTFAGTEAASINGFLLINAWYIT